MVLFFRQLTLTPAEARAFTVSAVAPAAPATFTVRVVAAAATDPAVVTANATLAVAAVLVADVPAKVRVGDVAAVAAEVRAPQGATFPTTLSVSATVDGATLTTAAGEAAVAVELAGAAAVGRATFELAPSAAGAAVVVFSTRGATATAAVAVQPAGVQQSDGAFERVDGRAELLALPADSTGACCQTVNAVVCLLFTNDIEQSSSTRVSQRWRHVSCGLPRGIACKLQGPRHMQTAL